MFNIDLYTFHAKFSVEDDAFIGKCVEFPSLAVDSSSNEGAIIEIRSLVQSVIEDLTKSGEPIPEPSRRLSGNVKLSKGHTVFMFQGNRNLCRYTIATIGPKWMTLSGLQKHVKFSVIDGKPAPDTVQPYSYGSCILWGSTHSKHNNATNALKMLDQFGITIGHHHVSNIVEVNDMILKLYVTLKNNFYVLTNGEIHCK